jgi:hypothetical protein
MICKWIYSKCERNYRQSPPAIDERAYHMFRFAPIANAEQVQRSFQNKSYPLPIPDDRPQLIVVFREY